jgi:deoxyribonuclease V
MPDIKQLSYTDIKIGGDVYGRALRTHSAVKPIFLSIGNRMNLELATQLTNELVTKESHIPLPTRLADIMTHEIRKRYYKV